MKIYVILEKYNNTNYTRVIGVAFRSKEDAEIALNEKFKTDVTTTKIHELEVI